MTTETIPLRDLKLSDAASPRTHGRRNLDSIRDAIRAVGWTDPGTVDEDNRVIVGSGRLQAGAEAGITEAVIIDAEGDEAIFVRRRGLTEAQKVLAAVASNRTAELAGWEPEALKLAVAEGAQMIGWTADELHRVLEEGSAGAPDFMYDTIEFDQAGLDEYRRLTLLLMNRSTEPNETVGRICLRALEAAE